MFSLSSKFANLISEQGSVMLMDMTKSLGQLTAEYRDATDKLADVRDHLAAAVRAEFAAGKRQADIVREIDHVWTREYVAKLIKNPPAPVSRPSHGLPETGRISEAATGPGEGL
jgi:allophanate hydrolase subunit 1